MYAQHFRTAAPTWLTQIRFNIRFLNLMSTANQSIADDSCTALMKN